MYDKFRPIAILALRKKIGLVLRYPMLDENNKPLISKGNEITEEVLQNLISRRIASVRLHVVDRQRSPGPPAFQRPTHYASAASRELDDEIAVRKVLKRRIDETETTLSQPIFKSILDWYRAIRKRQERDEHLAERCDILCQSMSERYPLRSDAFYRLLEIELERIHESPDIACTMLTPPDYVPYPARHSVLVARLSMTVASYLGWTRSEILAVGLGALVHDIGMLRIRELVDSRKIYVSPVARPDLVKHPIYSLSLLGSATRSLHEYVRYIVYQTHERGDGSGYPRARRMEQIHPAARIVGMVDAYVAAISRRPHRSPMLPHQAIQTLWNQTKSGKWDPEIAHALLRTLSMFPLGSFAELSDGRFVRVLQANPNIERPVVEVWLDPAAIVFDAGELLDLSHSDTLWIVRGIAPPQMISESTVAGS